MKRICEIKGLEEIKSGYWVTTCGKILSEPNTTRSTLRILKPHKDKGGYNRIILLDKYGFTKHYLVHRLVTLAFIDIPKEYSETLPLNKIQVNHKNEIKTDNYIQNLEWCDCTYNNNYGNRNKKAGINITKALKDNPKLSTPIIQYTLDGKFVKEWISQSKVTEELGYKAQNIGACCLGKQRWSNGFVWRFKGDSFDKYSFERKRPQYKWRKVSIYTLEGEFVKIFDNITDASRFINGSVGNIVKCCQHKINYYKGYIWRYTDEMEEKNNEIHG